MNCLGNALAAYTLAILNNIPVVFLASETHTWIVTSSATAVNSSSVSESSPSPSPNCSINQSYSNDDDTTTTANTTTTLIDVQGNIKAWKNQSAKGLLPLSIFMQPQQLDWFALCLLVIVNDGGLADEDVYAILSFFEDKLRYSWERSKLFSFALELDKDYDVTAYLSQVLVASSVTSSDQPPGSDGSDGSVGCDVTITPCLLPTNNGLATNCNSKLATATEISNNSIEYHIQCCVYYISHRSQPKSALTAMYQLLTLIKNYCLLYTFNHDMWLLKEGSFLHIPSNFSSFTRQSGYLLTKFQSNRR